MIHSVYIITAIGDILVEKHYRAPVSRSVLDGFFEAQTKARNPEDVQPIIPSSRHYLISIYRNKLHFVAVVQTETPPLFVVEFLHCAVDTLDSYFKVAGEREIMKETVITYQLLEEMLDNGFPLATELNVLKEMIRPPKWTNVFDGVTGNKNVKDTLPSGQLTNTTWRRAGVKYTNNEVFVDVVEEVDAIIDKNGTTISAEIQGALEFRCKLSGMPDLTLTFMNAGLLDDVSFHPCVRLKVWASERYLSFVPPDGPFTLVKYMIGPQNQVPLPIYVRPEIIFSEHANRLDIELGHKQNMGKQVESVVVTIPMPKAVNNVTISTVTLGTWTYDQVDRVVRWEVKKMPLDKPLQLRGSIFVTPGEMLPESNPTIQVQFQCVGNSASGLKINKLDVSGEKYKPFKGVKYITKAGSFQVRT